MFAEGPFRATFVISVLGVDPNDLRFLPASVDILHAPLVLL